MSELTVTQIEQQANALRRIETELDTVLRQSKEASQPVVLDQQSVGRLSRIDAIQQQKMVEANRRRQTLRLQKVRAALDAIDADDYGFCRRCDELIGWRRLQAQPECTVCLECQSQLENRGRQSR
ncbi:MAG: TraR/DksA C4-type zinc finger protein [Myxococcota bacterium]|nr:TraR/DksA C4-type zinc finger protein [Myxococcota bacterium]